MGSVRALSFVCCSSVEKRIFIVCNNGTGYMGWITLLDSLSSGRAAQLETVLFAQNCCGDDGAKAFGELAKAASEMLRG